MPQGTDLTNFSKEEKENLKLVLKYFEEIVVKLIEDEELNPVSRHLPPGSLEKELNLKLNGEGVDIQTWIQEITQLALATPKTASKAFFNQLFGGRMPQAILGELLTVILNNSMYTYKAAGAQVGVEKEMVNWVLNLLDWTSGNGTFVAGGSLANFKGMLMARDAKFPESKDVGVNKVMRVYTSQDSHYSIAKNASFAGIGRENVVKIFTDEKGKMNIEDLENQILYDLSNGFTPLMINCTAGTTVLGAFDDINEASRIAKKYDLWLHVDGAYCGAVVLSPKYKFLIDGVEHADSFCFNAHKMLGTPLSCSLFFAKDEEQLYSSFSNEAEYLYQTDEDAYNLGKISLQCGRRNDALKLWTLWKQIGHHGIAKLVDRQFELAEYASLYVNNHADYEVFGEQPSISVCFNYKKIDPRELCTSLYENEISLVGYGQFNNDEFIRLVTVNTNLDHESIDKFFASLEEHAAATFN